MPRADMQGLSRDVETRVEALLFLGHVDDEASAGFIDLALEPAFLQAVRRAHESAWGYDAKRRHAYLGTPWDEPMDRRVSCAALLAGAKMRRPGAAEAWHRVHAEGAPAERAMAASALCSLGDDSCRETIEPFLDDRDSHDPALRRWSWRGNALGLFQRTALYLRSPETDALLLQRIETGLSVCDRVLKEDLPFSMQYADRLVPVLVRHLQHRDFVTRIVAHEWLQEILGIEVSWDQTAPAHAQPAAVEEFRKAAADFLAGVPVRWSRAPSRRKRKPRKCRRGRRRYMRRAAGETRRVASSLSS